MPKIDYTPNKKTIKLPLKDLPMGVYLIKERNNGMFCVMSIVARMIHFHKPQASITHSTVDYNTFYEDFEIIGKIKDFTITDIELEN